MIGIRASSASQPIAGWINDMEAGSRGSNTSIEAGNSLLLIVSAGACESTPFERIYAAVDRGKSKPGREFGLMSTGKDDNCGRN